MFVFQNALLVTGMGKQHAQFNKAVDGEGLGGDRAGGALAVQS